METFFPLIVSCIKKVLKRVGACGCGCPEKSGLWLPAAVDAATLLLTPAAVNEAIASGEA
jgi:hypothetical protein